MENIGSKFMTYINDYLENDILIIKLESAKFNKKILNSYNVKMELIEKDIVDKLKVYNKKAEEVEAIKSDILSKYKAEFQKVYDRRKNQFSNIMLSMQQMRANQSISLANMNQVLLEREKFINNENTYKEYIQKKTEFEARVNSTLNHEEYDKYTKLLEDLKDPLLLYRHKIEVLVQKYDNFDEVIDSCEEKLEDCIEATLSDFENIMKSRGSNELAVVKKQNAIMNVINKLFKSFGSSKNFEKNFTEKVNAELEIISKNNNVLLGIIDSQTLSILDVIEEAKVQIKNEYVASMQA